MGLRWTKEQTAAELNVSTKTVDKLTGKGKLNPTLTPREGKPPALMFDSDEVTKLAAERGALAEQLPMVQPAAAAPVRAARQAEALPAPVRRDPPPFMTFEEASEHYGLSQSYLKRQCDNGLLVWIAGAGRGGKNVILKASLDRLGELLMRAASDTASEQ